MESLLKTELFECKLKCYMQCITKFSKVPLCDNDIVLKNLVFKFLEHTLKVTCVNVMAKLLFSDGGFPFKGMEI